MNELGLLIYGYEIEEAEIIKSGIQEIMGRNIVMISASGSDDSVVGEILDKGGSGKFEDSKVKFLMFLGFDDESIGRVMNGFPGREGMKRPIFCALTETNIQWTIEVLIKDLLEEEAYWRNRKKQ